MRPSELAGLVAGALFGPAAGLGAVLRRSRPLHPRGVVFWATAHKLPAQGPAATVATLLPARALVRLSGALWKGPSEWADILGLAVRFCAGAGMAPAPSAGDQDLLFATVRSPFTLPFAIASTKQHDYLANDYFAIAPFDVPGYGPARLRVRPRPAPSAPGATREERLAAQVERGEAAFVLEVAPAHRGAAFTEALELRLERPSHIDQATLRFSPFRTGAGIKPRGFLHSMRVVPYLVSQSVRSEMKR